MLLRHMRMMFTGLVIFSAGMTLAGCRGTEIGNPQGAGAEEEPEPGTIPTVNGAGLPTDELPTPPPGGPGAPLDLTFAGVVVTAQLDD